MGDAVPVMIWSCIIQELSGSGLGAEATQAIAVNNKIAERLMTGHSSNQRSVAQEGLKLMDGLVEKVHTFKTKPA